MRAVSAGYYKSHPFDPALIAEFERLTQDSSLFGDRYITIMQIDETEYRRVVDRPSVIVPRRHGAPRRSLWSRRTEGFLGVPGGGGRLVPPICGGGGGGHRLHEAAPCFEMAEIIE